jgi:hypothetical protein
MVKHIVMWLNLEWYVLHFLFLFHMDGISIRLTFHGTLSKEVYMIQPFGVAHPQHPTHICKLQKALYVLKQAPRAWFSRLSSKLLTLGFHSSQSDTSLFIHRTSEYLMLVLIYVDNILITCSSSIAIQSLLTTLHNDFAVKDLGPLIFFLGIEVLPCAHGDILSQQRYIMDILKRAKMTKAKLVTSKWLHVLIFRHLKVTCLLTPYFIDVQLKPCNFFASHVQVSPFVSTNSHSSYKNLLMYIGNLSKSFYDI